MNRQALYLLTPHVPMGLAGTPLEVRLSTEGGPRSRPRRWTVWHDGVRVAESGRNGHAVRVTFDRPGSYVLQARDARGTDVLADCTVTVLATVEDEVAAVVRLFEAGFSPRADAWLAHVQARRGRSRDELENLIKASVPRTPDGKLPPAGLLALVCLYAPEVLERRRGYAGLADLPDDLQEAILRLLDPDRNYYNPAVRFGPYFSTIVGHKGIDRVRRDGAGGDPADTPPDGTAGKPRKRRRPVALTADPLDPDAGTAGDRLDDDEDRERAVRFHPTRARVLAKLRSGIELDEREEAWAVRANLKTRWGLPLDASAEELAAAAIRQGKDLEDEADAELRRIRRVQRDWRQRDNSLDQPAQDEDKPLSPEQRRQLDDPAATRRATVRPLTDEEVHREFPWLRPADRCRDEKQFTLRRLGDDLLEALRGLRGACAGTHLAGLAADVNVRVGALVEGQRRNARPGTVPAFDRLVTAAERLEGALDPRRLPRAEADALAAFRGSFRAFRAEFPVLNQLLACWRLCPFLEGRPGADRLTRWLQAGRWRSTLSEKDRGALAVLSARPAAGATPEAAWLLLVLWSRLLDRQDPAAYEWLPHLNALWHAARGPGRPADSKLPGLADECVRAAFAWDDQRTPQAREELLRRVEALDPEAAWELNRARGRSDREAERGLDHLLDRLALLRKGVVALRPKGGPS
jgi:hypothetical protein